MIEKLICGAMILLAILLNGCSVRYDPVRTERELAYAEAVSMNIFPTNYIGKMRTVTGKSISTYFAMTDMTYYSVAVPNADGTNTEEIEYLLPNGDYPADGIPVTVTGEFEVYLENGVQYCRLKDAQITMNGDFTHE